MFCTDCTNKKNIVNESQTSGISVESVCMQGTVVQTSSPVY